MDDSSNLELFLRKYLETKDINWVNLLVFECSRHSVVSKKELIAAIVKNGRYTVYTRQLAYHLVRLLFTTLNELIGNGNGDKSGFQNFITRSIGGKIILLLSDPDLADLSNVINERELVDIFIQLFPAERWEENMTVSKLIPPSKCDVRSIFKIIQLSSRSVQTGKGKGMDFGAKVITFGCIHDEERGSDCNEYEQYMTEEYRAFHESFCLSSAELAMNILIFFCKLVEVENVQLLRRTSVTVSCLGFSFKTLKRLHEQTATAAFSDSDQSVIVLKLLELVYRCFNSLLKCDDMPIQLEYKQLISLLHLSNRDFDFACGLLLATLNIIGHCCIKSSVPNRREMLSELTRNKNMVLETIEFLKINTEYLFVIQRGLIKIICAIKKTSKPQYKKRNSNRAPLHDSTQQQQHHHHQLKEMCIFEGLLIDSLLHVTKYRHLAAIMNYLRINGICCCNASIKTIRMFMRSTTIAAQYLNFLERRIVRVMFEKACVNCRQKLQSTEFQSEYFGMLQSEIQRRQGLELHLLLHHLFKIHRIMTKEFGQKFITSVIVPTFIREKSKFISDPECNQTAKLITQYSLQILCDSARGKSKLEDILTLELVNHLKDCSLVPLLSANSCTILRYGLECLDSANSTQIVQQIKSILFGNIQYLIGEVMDIYEQVGLPKSEFVDSSGSTSNRFDASGGFEILNEQTVIVKEILSNMDVLLLSTIHWKILRDLIVKQPSLQSDLVANICNNFNGDVIFTTAQYALNSILLKKESAGCMESKFKNIVKSESKKMANSYERCDYLSPIIIVNYDINYDLIINRSYKLFEICQNFTDKLSDDTDLKNAEKNSLTMIYSSRRDKRAMFKRATIHRDNFLTDNIEEYVRNARKEAEKQGDAVENSSSSFYGQHLLNTFKTGMGILESRNIRDAFVKIVNRFFRADEELKAIYRVNTIGEITTNYGLRYLSSIARNCFDICFRLLDNNKFSIKMSTALEELKLFLLQEDWDENRETMIEVLQILLGVAEMKSNSINQLMLTNLENHLACESSFPFDGGHLSKGERFNIAFSDSEDDGDCSRSSEDDKKTEIYFTADENYDADEEYFSTQADDSTECSRSSYKTSSATTILQIKNTNEHICKLVVEVMIDLSKRCLENREQWKPELLTSLAKRLSCMKKFLGGSEFLLKGFSPLFTENNLDYAPLQTSILELIGDFSSLESLGMLFSLLTVNTVPVELLISRFEAVCKQQLALTAFSGVQYPIYSLETTVTSTCDTYIHRSIQSYRDIHLSHKLLTPFTEASQIIPLNFLDLKIWNSNGFTISTWIDMRVDNSGGNTDDYSTIHLVSFGSDRLLLAVFLNADGSFSFNVIKPNQTLAHARDKMKINRLLIDNQSSTADTSKSADIFDKENVNKTNIFGIATAILKDREMPNIRTRSSLRNGIKKSLSKEEDRNRRMETSKVSVKSKKQKIKSSQWTHVCLSLKIVDSHLSILLTLNGTEHESIEIPMDEMLDSDANGMLQLLFVGAQKMASEEALNAISYTMSNILLFKVPLEAYLISFLFALGPDCDNFVDCEVKQIIPLREYINLSKQGSKSSLKNGMLDFFHRLQSYMILSLSVGKSHYATAFMDKNSEHGKTLDIFTIGRIPKAANIDSLQHAVLRSGGLSTLLFLFARTVELTEDPDTQSSALFIFLKFAYSNNHLYAEFEQKKMFNLVAHVFKHGNCYRGPGMLKAILDVIYGGSMFLKRSKRDIFEINERSELNLQNPSLLMKLLTHFNIFHASDAAEAGILDLLFKSLMVVVRDSHPFNGTNRQCLIDHGFYGKIIEFCKIHLCNTAGVMTAITKSTAHIVIDLLKMLSKNPPTQWSINEIQKLLMLLHHPSESFITHDRSKFSFILSSQKPSKSKSSSSILSSKYFNFSTKIRSTSVSIAVPSISPTGSQRSSLTIGNSNNTPPKSPRLLVSSDGTSLFNEAESKVPKNSAILSLARKFKTRKFDELTESQILKMTTALKEIKCRKDLKTPTKRQTKRLRSTPKSSPFKKTSTPVKHRTKSDEKDEVDQELVTKFENLMSSSHLNLSEDDDDRIESGVSVLQEHLFSMLKDAVILLDDTRKQNELPECFKIESLIMFANHFDPNVRASIINLIHALTTRQPTNLVNSYTKQYYWVHLGNQLSISPINLNILQATIDWICVEKITLNDSAIPSDIKLKFKPAFKILIAMLPSMTHDAQLLKYATAFLNTTMESPYDCFPLLTENGLITSCIKALIKISDESMSESVQVMLQRIARKSFTMTGTMNLVWDLLYGLTYAERQNKNGIIREVHMTILNQLLTDCLETRKASRAGSESQKSQLAIKKALENLPSSEVKTRFNLLHDRAIQFVLSWENVDELRNSEIDFVKYLIGLHFFGMQQGSTLVLWSLNPSCCDEIKLYSAQKIIAALTFDASFSTPEPKVLKSLLSHLINSNSCSFSEEQTKVIAKYCGTSVSQQQQNWNWSITALEKIETIRQNATKDQLQQVDKVIYKLELLVQTCIDSAMRMTRDVIDIQNKERRKLINQLKRTQEIDYYREWKELIQRMIHEGAPWYNEDLYPTSFELDETEGPGRMRIRLKRAILKIEERFFLEEFKHKSHYQHNKQLLAFLLYPNETERYSISDQIIFTFNGKHLTMEQEIDGEIIITDSQLIFLATRDTYTNSIICSISEIDEIWNRRYQHKEVALEIFLKCSKNFFIIFETNYERDTVNTYMIDKIDGKGDQKIEAATQKWAENKLTNYEYLMELNKISGRSFNDLMQYPVFPWILVHYDGDTLDLTSPDTFRKLNKTISTQYENAEDHYVTNYRYLMDQFNDHQSIMKPYHYSSHYSNSGTVLHFLVRLPPFTNMFLLYQDHNFDIPDRTFHSMATTFRLTSKESATDVKELVPEFFNLPDFLENSEGFNYGRRQSGEQVGDVKLPEWSENSSRLFMLIQRQALESEHVRRNLHQWIDLIFGFKQKGKAAIEAVNVFHPATYPEFQISNITDVVERSAYETMVRTYGQMPKQIFVSPHKKASIQEKNYQQHSILRGVKGLKHGIFTGSLQLPKPKKLTAKTPIICKQKDSKLVLVRELNMFFVVPSTSCLMKGSQLNNYDLVLWKEIDGIVRTKSLTDKRSRKIFSAPTCDPITSCGAHINYIHLWFGHSSGNISVFSRTDEKQHVKKRESSQKAKNATLEDILDIRVDNASRDLITRDSRPAKSMWNYPIILLRHQGEVVNIKICTEFKIVVSIGNDGRTVIWDSQKFEYIRTIEPSCNALRACLTHVDISPTLGDILTVFKPKNEECHDEVGDECFEISESNRDDFVNVSVAISGKSQLRLHNINGKYIGHVFSEGIITAVCFSSVKEGTGMNVVAVAVNDGSVRLYSTWNLAMIREIATGCESMIKEISYSTNQYLILLTEHEIHLWGSDGLSPERPNFHDIIFV